MINDSPIARWSVLIIVAFTMMMGYFITDVMSPLEQLLEQPIDKGGLGWSSADYGFFSGSSGFINVFLLMLFFSGLHTAPVVSSTCLSGVCRLRSGI